MVSVVWDSPVGGSLGCARAVLLVQVALPVPPSSWDRQVTPWDSASDTLGCSEASWFPLQSLQHSLHGEGGKNRPPPAKTAKESESWGLYSRNPEREGGAGLSSRRCL